jgi:tetratricopeptide (TPR) repeat protein
VIARSVTLADTLLREGKPPLEAEIELTAAVTLLERRLGRKALEGLPEGPLLFWYMARVVRGEGRARDSRRLFDRAVRSARAAAEADPGSAPDMARLEELLQADRAWRPGSGEPPAFPRSPRIFFEEEAAYAAAPAPPSPPAAMRLELQAWKLLGRIGEFGPRIDEALAASEPGTADRLRYQSVRLRYLEEIGDWPGLFEELEAMATSDPPLEDPRARALFVSSARSYEARKRLASGDPDGAVEAYRKAAAALEGVTGTEEALSEIRREISLLAPEGAPGGTGEGDPSGGDAPAASGGDTTAASGGDAPAASGGDAQTASGGDAPTASGGEAPAASGGDGPAASGGDAQGQAP